MEDLDEFLSKFGIPLKYNDKVIGEATTKIYLKCAEPFRLTKILSLEKELSMFFKKPVTLDIEQEYITITVPNEVRNYPKNKNKNININNTKLPINIGVAYNKNIKINLADMPHMIVAGTTGSGKSVLLRNIMNQLEDYVFLDGKTNTLEEVSTTLDKFVALMDKRYKLFTSTEECFKLQRGSCDIDLWNKIIKPKIKMERIVIIIDEYADLSMQDRALNYKVRYNIENKIVRLMQKARAAGIHVILATQRPDAKTISGLIRANAPR